MAPSQEGERAERLTNTLLGAKDGGRHHQERTSASTSLRCTRRRCALTTLSYDNMVPGPKSGAKQRICEPKIYYNRPNSGPTDGQRFSEGGPFSGMEWGNLF